MSLEITAPREVNLGGPKVRMHRILQAVADASPEAAQVLEKPGGYGEIKTIEIDGTVVKLEGLALEVSADIALGDDYTLFVSMEHPRIIEALLIYEGERSEAAYAIEDLVTGTRLGDVVELPEFLAGIADLKIKRSPHDNCTFDDLKGRYYAYATIE